MRFAGAAHPLRGRRPAWTTGRAGLRLDFDFFGQARVVEDRLGNLNTT
jgi:hypothetical protein